MTAQVKDTLIYNNEELYIAAEPLANYLKTVKLPYKLVAPHTACWRGYISKWAIDNKKLFLIEWRGYILDCQEVGMGYLFPDEDFVFADWFTGEIKIGMGKMIAYVHGGYNSVYEGNMYLIFENGVLVNQFTKWLTKEEIERISNEYYNDEFPF